MEYLKFSRLVEFNNAGRSYLEANSEERSQTTFALNKLLKFYQKTIDKIQREWQEEINESAEEIRVKYCEKEDGIFKEKTYGEGKNLITKKVFKSDKEQLANKEIKAKNKEIEQKWMDFIITEIKTHIVPVPAKMDILAIELFSGFIFEPMTDENLQDHYLAQAQEKPKPELMENGHR